MKLLLAAQLLFVGAVWHDGDVPAKAAGPWLALYGGAAPKLATVTVKTARVYDPITDEPAEPPTGWKVEAPGEPLCLVRQVPGLTPGPVARARVEAGSPATAPRAITLGRHTWRLVPEAMKPLPDAKDWFQHGRLVLTDGKLRQTLITLDGTGEISHESWGVDFAGDLDRDGKPDLLMSLKHGMVGVREVLFLSGGAGPGRLVREVAVFEGGGC